MGSVVTRFQMKLACRMLTANKSTNLAKTLDKTKRDLGINAALQVRSIRIRSQTWSDEAGVKSAISIETHSNLVRYQSNTKVTLITKASTTIVVFRHSKHDWSNSARGELTCSKKSGSQATPRRIALGKKSEVFPI